MLATRAEIGREPRQQRRLLAAGALAVLAATTFSPGDTGAVHLVGQRAERTERMTYAPGQSRTWDAGGQVQGVRVVRGTLTVRGDDGSRQVYEAGQGYAAGWGRYRASNETSAPVQVLVTTHENKERH